MTSKLSQNQDLFIDTSPLTHDFATVRDIAELLRVPDTWVYERTRRRGIERIPHFKLGKYLRFSRREVLQWIEHQRGNSLAPR